MAGYLFRLLAVACLAFPLWAGAETLRVVGPNDYPPYLSLNQKGEPEGYEVDLWKLFEKKTGIQVELTATRWADAQQDILAGRADVIDVIVRTPARAALYDFTPPVDTLSSAIYADASISGIHDLQSLKGFLVGVEKGDVCVERLQAAGITSLVQYPNLAALARALAAQAVKIACMDERPADYYLYRLGAHKKFVKVFDMHKDPWRRAVRKGDAQALATVNQGMALISDAEKQALHDKWMGRPVVFTEYAALLGRVLLGLTVVIGALLVWLASVRKAVRVRTAQLEDEKARLRTLVENSPDVIWLKDGAGRYLSCNGPGATLLGKRQQDVLGKTDFDLFDAPTAQQFRANDQRALQAPGPVASEERVVFPETGETHVFDTLRTAVVKPGGAVRGVLGVARDVTLRRLQERRIREQEQLLEEMSELAKIGGWEFDLLTGHVLWTEELARIHETSQAGAHSIPNCLSYYHDENRAKVERYLRCAIKTGQPCDFEVEMVTDRGNRKWVRALCRPVVEDGKVVKVRGTIQDVTQRRTLEESMRMANLIYQTSSEAIAVTDAANMVVDANPAYLRQTGRSLDQTVGHRPAMFGSDMHDDEFYERLWNELALHDYWQGEIWDRRPDGGRAARVVSIRVIRDPDGKVFRRVIQFTDITEQKIKDELIWKQTNFDALTGLPNRSLFVDRLGQEIKKGHEAGTALGVMFIDLDRFQQVNDIFGRAKGDRALLEVTRRLRACLPETATLARLGGDSFAVAMAAVEKRLHLEVNAESLVAAVAAPLPLGGDEHAYVTASVGIALYPEDGTQAEELIRNAELAMSMAKEEGRGHFSFFTRSHQREAQAKLTLTNDLRHALARQELHVFYQPIVEVATGRIRKAETLLRWAHPVHGMVSPARFIPLAEESGLIGEIGEWVIQEAIASIERWRVKYGCVVELSVNNSPAQFEPAGECKWLERLLGSGLPPGSLTIEITEGVLVKDSDQVRTCIDRLHEIGARVSIDDFGTGFSALSYLKHFDVDYLKIDKSFIVGLCEDDNDKALTEAIIDMAHKLGIRAIAEGVETGQQRDLLERFGCDYIQGYLYSRAVPREIFEMMLAPQGYPDDSVRSYR